VDNTCTVQVKLELGHRAQLRKKPTTEGFTHDWMVFVRGPEQCDIQHFVERVVFRLHESFPKPKRVCKEPPYKVEESGYAGFIMPIEVHFKNKEEPKKVCFTYDLFLNLEGNPPVNHLRCEKLTFNNPTKEFRRKLIRAGGVMVMPEGAETVSRPSPDYPMLPTIPLSAFSDPKKTKPSHGSKDANKESSKASKPHKVTKEHRERPRKDSESKNSSKDLEREQNKPLKDSSRKPTENKLPKEEKAPPKAAFKEPKLAVKETKLENTSPKGGPQPELKSSSKRPSNVESPKPSAKKQKKSSSKGVKNILGTSPRTSSSSYPEKKQTKEKMNAKVEKVKSESEAKEIKKPVEMEESNSEDETSFKSEVSRDLSSTRIFKHAASGRKSPESCNKPEKILKKGTYDKAYTDELVELHRRLMALRERNVLQQIVNLIEETGHFNVTNTTFDFDLFSLDETTVRKLQSYLEAVAT
uniref:MLLT1 super elongation complex subunit n=1 Tax=Bubo bubo TaxID=30461 RepID=A0A8C0FX83_BUBBB